MAFPSPSGEWKRRRLDRTKDHYGACQEPREATPADARSCQLCELPTRGETHIPNGDADWVCRDHATMFWQGLIRVGSGLAELGRQMAEDTPIDEEEANLHVRAIRESGMSPA